MYRSIGQVFGFCLCLALAVSLPACRSSGPSGAGSANASVVEVIDGDTVRLRFSSGDEVVRLLGVDTPETVDPNRPAQCFGAEASAYLRQLLPVGRQVLIVRDHQTRDAFGRLLAYLFLDDGTFINLELVRNGFADTLSIEPNTTYRSEFAAALRLAKSTNAGLWASCDGADQPLTPDSP